jgi:polysaccharide export outer membrane protein
VKLVKIALNSLVACNRLPCVCLCVWAFLVAAGCNSSKSIVFKSKETEAIYRQGRKQKLAVIKNKESRQSPALYRYLVRPGDELTIKFLNLPPELGTGTFGLQANSIYKVNIDGYVYPPLIGKLYVRDKSIDEITTLLTQEYSSYYVNPSLDVSVSNLRIYIYGDVGKPGVVILPTERTHLVEALAIAGGVKPTAKNYKIKIIRGDRRDPQIIWIDLTQSEVLSSPELLMQSEDIVVVEPKNIILVAEAIAPYRIILSLTTLLPTIFLILRSFGVV